MAEMNAISRFFVNRSAARRSRRRLRWFQATAEVPPSAVCLEIGSGNGEFADQFLTAFHPARYVATDLDPRQLEEARRHLLKRHESGLPATLDLRPADMTALPFSDASFDVVFAFVCLHHAGATHRDFSRVPIALGEIDRVLRDGGRLAYSEILHQEAIRAWLVKHRYELSGIERRFRVESVVARKPRTVG